MNEKFLNEILTADNFDKIENIINGVEDKEELLELYDEVQDMFQQKFDIYKNKKSSILGSLKNFFADDETRELKNINIAATSLVEKKYEIVCNEMYEDIENFFSYRSETANNTIGFFIYYLPEIKNNSVDINSYKKCIEYVDDSDVRFKEIVNDKILNSENFKKMSNFTGYDKLDQKISAESQDGFVSNAVQGYNIRGSVTAALMDPSGISAIYAAKTAFDWVKSLNSKSREEVIQYIKVGVEYIELVEKVISEFKKIISTIEDLKDKIEKLDEEISDLDEYFVPIIADYDEKDVYCVQIFNKYSGLISSMHTLLMTEIL